jgi:xanthine dehydrogenase accessory factor
MNALGQLLEDGTAAVLVTVISIEGDPPSRPGAKLLLAGDRVVAGTLGCSEFDTAGAGLAAELRPPAAATLRRRAVFGHGRQQVLELFAERFEPSPGAIVAGGGPVGAAVADLATAIGWRVRILGEHADPLDDLTRQPPGPRDAVVVSDHDAPWAAAVLRLALGSQAFFVGMLGSRRHAPRVLDELRGAGVAPDRVAALHTPCGLDIGARSPAEIGLSIVAELVAAERGRPGGSLSARL